MKGRIVPEVDQAFLHKCQRLAALLRLESSNRKNTYAAYCELQEWLQLGHGHFSRVFEHPKWSGLVFKFSGPAHFGYNARLARRPTVRSDAWPVFARHCWKFPHPNLPAILHFEQMSPRYSWAIMPKYSSLVDCWYDMIPRVDNEAPDTWAGEVGQALVSGGSGLQRRTWLMPIHTMVESLGISVDVHQENVMLDEVNNCFILTDPFSFMPEPGIEVQYASS